MEMILIEGEPDWRIRLGPKLWARASDEEVVPQLYMDEGEIAGRLNGVNAALHPLRFRCQRQPDVAMAYPDQHLASARQRAPTGLGGERQDPTVFAGDG